MFCNCVGKYALKMILESIFVPIIATLIQFLHISHFSVLNIQPPCVG